MANPYGSYGPAQAIRDTSESLSDVIKAFAGIKLREAEMDLQGKRLDLETQKVQNAAQLEFAKSELAAATDQANIRLHGQQLGETSRHNIAMEGISKQQADTSARQADIHSRQVAIQEREEKRLNMKMKWGDAVRQSAMPPEMKSILLSNTDPEGLNQEVTVRDFQDFAKNVLEKSPKAMFTSLLSSLNVKLEGIKKKAQAVKTPEEAEALTQQWAEGVSHVMTLRAILGTGPGPLTDEQEKAASDLAGRVYKDNPENFPGGITQAITETRKGMQSAKDSYWNDSYGPDALKSDIDKALGRTQAVEPQWSDKHKAWLVPGDKPGTWKPVGTDKSKKPTVGVEKSKEPPKKEGSSKGTTSTSKTPEPSGPAPLATDEFAPEDRNTLRSAAQVDLVDVIGSKWKGAHQGMLSQLEEERKRYAR